MNEPQGFFGAILKPFALKMEEEKRTSSSPRDLPNDPTEPESDADSYHSKKHAEEDSDDELPVEGDDFAPVMPTKPFTKRGSFLTMIRKSNSSRMMVDPTVLEAAEETEKEEMDKENTPAANDDNKGNKTNDKNPSNDDEKSPEVTEKESISKNVSGLLEMFFKPKETNDVDAKANCAIDNETLLDQVPSKESTAASNEGETEDKNINNNEQTPDPEDNKEGLGFFGKLFQRKDLPDIKEENDETLGSEEGVGDAVENVEHVESMYHSAKEYVDSSDETNSSEPHSEAAALEAAGDEKALVQSENLESSRRSSAASQKRSSSFIGMLFDTGTPTEDVLENETETEHPAKEILVQEDSPTEEDSVEVSPEAQFYPEETGLELEAEAGNSEVPRTLDDPYVDDNEKGQKEKICCSFPFC